MGKDFQEVLDEMRRRIEEQDDLLEAALRDKGLTREDLRAFARGRHLPAHLRAELEQSRRTIQEDLRQTQPDDRPIERTTRNENEPLRLHAGWLRG